MNYDSFGNLRVRTFTAAGALPIENALIKIYGAESYNNGIAYSLLTDNDGITQELSLPAPLKLYSASPGAKESPYAVYNVEIAKDGFYPKQIENVPIFSGTSAVLPIEMIPLSYMKNGDIAPQSNLNSIIYENEHLQ